MSERLWWSVLLEAETQSEILCRRDGIAALHASEVAGIARKTLRDQYGVNLDLYSDQARTIYANIYQERVEAEKERERILERSKEAVKQAKKLLAQPKKAPCTGCYYVPFDSRDGGPRGGCDECRQGPHYR